MSDDGIKKRTRNLRQHRNKTDEEFEEYWDARQSNAEPSAEFERRIQRKLVEFADDYDIGDLKINDRNTLRALIQAEIALEDYEQMIFRMRQEGDTSPAAMNSFDKFNRIMSELRADISRFQMDLNITRKIRKSDKESTVVNYIDSLKLKAKQFYESRMSYVFCPECNMLISTVWTLYPESDNKLTFVCKRPMADGSKCNHKFSVTTRELLENKNTNNTRVIPESLA